MLTAEGSLWKKVKNHEKKKVKVKKKNNWFFKKNPLATFRARWLTLFLPAPVTVAISDNFPARAQISRGIKVQFRRDFFQPRNSSRFADSPPHSLAAFSLSGSMAVYAVQLSWDWHEKLEWGGMGSLAEINNKSSVSCIQKLCPVGFLFFFFSSQNGAKHN